MVGGTQTNDFTFIEGGCGSFVGSLSSPSPVSDVTSVSVVVLLDDGLAFVSVPVTASFSSVGRGSMMSCVM